jgi:subtilisin family serine protease
MISTRAIIGALCVGMGICACVSDSNVAPLTGPLRASLRAQPAATPSLSGATGSNAEGRYLVVFKSGQSSGASFQQAVQAAGGQVEGLQPDLGFAVVSGLSPDAANRVKAVTDVSSMDPDMEFSVEPSSDVEALAAAADLRTESATAPQTALLFGRQWNMRAVFANTAWAAGFLGSPDVSVAILDTGIDYTWPDLRGRVDTSRSISLRPTDDTLVDRWFPGRNHISDLAAHGTLVSSIVASNSGFFAGVTTQTTLFGVKVCTVFGTCSTAAIFNGIKYAVDHGADVINMSLGGGFPKNALPGFVAVINRVFNYANKAGVLIVVAAGNSSIDLDHDGNFYATYCNSPHVICVSATGPTSAATANGPFINPDAFAPYSNFGRSAISLAAPGGGISSNNVLVSGPCSSATLFFDDSTHTILGRLCPPPGLFLVRGNGTSFSAPHVTGAAAQLVALLGHGRASQIRARLQQSADDIGAPGKDPLFGKGRLNVARAVGANP